MILLDADSICASRPGKTLFTDTSITVSTGDRVGIVGLNGSGKTTLLRVLTGTVPPESGTVRVGRDVGIATLDQQPDLPEGRARDALGGSWEADAVLERLGMGQRAEADVATLSGGEARRVALARALVEDCDLLVLDEPTNHLDIDAIDWLEERLLAFKGGLLLVTHDRYLLDSLTNRVIEIEGGRVYQHEGGYDGYLAARADRVVAAAEAETRRRNLARRELAWLRRGAKARTRKSKAHLARAHEAISSRSERDLRDAPLDLHLGTPRLGDKVIELHKLGVAVPGRTLFSGLELLLSNRERLGIVGPNGSGKTTLLDVMAGRRQPDEGEVVSGSTVRLGYFDQTGRALDPNERVRDAMTSGEREPDWRDAALLEAFWFDTETQWAPISQLSGGERRRLQLVLTLVAQPNVLLLDEPTNDLDIDTLRALEGFLDGWPGALVVVSHDRAFLERTVSDVIVIDGSGTAGRWAGGLDAWLDARRAARKAGHATLATPQRQAAATQPSRGPSAQTGRAGGRSVSTIRHELKAIEAEMRTLEARVAELDASLGEAADDHEALARLGAQLTDAHADLESVEDRWLEVSSELEDR